MADDNKLELTRRKILAGAGAVGAAGAGAGLGTSALFYDEESYLNNSFTAGTVDLQVTADVVDVNPEYEAAVDDMVTEVSATADGDAVEAAIQLDDWKNGDWILVCWRILVRDNPSCLTLSAANVDNLENGRNEPEMSADDESPDEGELGEYLELELYDGEDGAESKADLGSPSASGSANDLLGYDTGGSTPVYGPVGIPGATEVVIYTYWELPFPEDTDRYDDDNDAQSDSFAFDFVFRAEQARNNDCEVPDDGGETEPDVFSINASPSSAGETDSVHRLELPVGSGLDGETLSTLTVSYPDAFDESNVDAGDVLNAGVQRPDSSITDLSISGVSSGSIEFSLDGAVTVSPGDTIFIEYRDMTNPSTASDYTVVVDINGSEIGPGTLSITPATGTTEPVTSTFDTGDEGWEIIGDAQGDSAVPNYETGIGNPAPSIGAVDDVLGGTWYFKAPGKFLADKSGFYGGTLEFDLRQDPDGNFQFDNDDIILEGAGMELKYDHGGTSSHPPDGSFGSYSVTLDESDDWTKDGSPATASEIQSVLGDVTGLFIRGEYESGADTGYLDNASINPP